ncbi:MAG TPA: zf-HC2 domain-containing protein [Planctomycetota bacterium]
MESCRKWSPRLTAWHDGEVSAMEAEEVRRHLIDCAGCRATASRWSRLGQDLALLQPAGPDAVAMDRMVHRFEAGLAGEVLSMARSLHVWRIAAAVLLALGLALVAAEELVLPRRAEATEPGRIEREIEREIVDLLQRPVTAPAPAATQRR